MKVLIVANLVKPKVKPAVEQLVPWLQTRAELVGVESDADFDLASVDVDLIIVLGGDGTLLSAARRLQGRQLPVMGFNFGRLGFLSQFSPEQLPDIIEQALNHQLPRSGRLMIETSIVGADQKIDLLDRDAVRARRKYVAIGLNDAVITAGAPFRMIELQVGTDRDAGVRYFGDGLIVCTASGSTAYNISAGGPILSPRLAAMCITPLCPHSLSFRPIVINANQVITLTARRVNRGSDLVVDGQASCNLAKGDRVVIRRAESDVILLENPQASEWQALGEKLNWASVPNYNWK
jgi:NAD+ kinase